MKKVITRVRGNSKYDITRALNYLYKSKKILGYEKFITEYNFIFYRAYLGAEEGKTIRDKLFSYKTFLKKVRDVEIITKKEFKFLLSNFIIDNNLLRNT